MIERNRSSTAARPKGETEERPSQSLVEVDGSAERRASRPTTSLDPAGSVPAFPFQWFRTAIAALKAYGLTPSRIDRSLWSNKHFGATNKELKSAFRFLGLIGENDAPTPECEALVKSFGAKDWSQRLSEVLRKAYPEVMASGIERSSVGQIFELFEDRYKIRGEARRRAVTFFLHAAREAEVSIAPFSSAAGRRRQLKAKAGASKAAKVSQELLNRLPAFDPDWSDDVKVAWFSAFSELVDRTRAPTRDRIP